MATFEIALNAFAYPGNLPNRKANFRFIVAISLSGHGRQFRHRARGYAECRHVLGV